MLQWTYIRRPWNDGEADEPGGSRDTGLRLREKRMNGKLLKTPPRLKEGLAELCGERLRGVYLLGSHARGEADAESDIDALIVLHGVDNYPRQIERTSELVSELSLECGRSISRVFVSEKRRHEDQTMFFLNLREEAVPAPPTPAFCRDRSAGPRVPSLRKELLFESAPPVEAHGMPQQRWKSGTEGLSPSHKPETRLNSSLRHWSCG
jgi:predicted nucleotidyltransferase